MTIDEAIELMRATADALPGAFRAEMGLWYHAGVTGPEAWACDVEGDLSGDGGGRFRILGRDSARGDSACCRRGMETRAEQ